MKKGRLIVSASEISADILYASGFFCPDPFIFFSAGSEKAVVLSTLEYQRALSQVKKGVKVYHDLAFAKKENAHPGKLELIIAISEKTGIKDWEVPPDFSLKYARDLEKKGIKTTISESAFFPARAVKTKREISFIAKAQKATESAMKMAQRMIAEASVDKNSSLILNGEILSSERLRSEIETELKRNGYSASRTITACGRQSSEPHNAGNGPLKAGQVIIADIFPRSDATGYWGDMTRTFFKGKAPSTIKRAFDAVFEAKEKSRAMLKAGVKAAAVYRKAFEVLEKRGFPTGSKNGLNYGFIHGLGHGVGLEIHEQPRVSPMNHGILEEGNVISVEPGLYYPEWGGIRIEDLAIIGESSHVLLNSPAAELEIP
ncbi:MAG: hypothetical protein A2020_03925 [Lentisphaerae bacterium GWF2_45_14]|nr:MAG: hypothetical protein A2020_03925 [Lentisphaerae bacterium GWF2_45_14]